MTRRKTTSSRDEADLKLAARLRRARERLGLSARGLSRLAKIPLATIAAIESGREPRWSTLMRYLETVPGLRAGHLVEGSKPRPPTLGASTWAFTQRAHGLWAERVTVRVRVRDDGSRDHELVVKGLSTSDDDEGTATLRMLMQVACVAAPAFIRQLAPPARGRTMVVEADGVRHSFRWTARRPPSLDYERTARLAPGEPENVTHRTGYPTRELTLVTTLPKGSTPPRACAWPSARDLEAEGSSIAAYIHAPPCSPALRRAGSTTRFTTRDVIPGLTHALLWSPPTASTQVEPPADRRRPATFAPIARELHARSGLSVRELARALSVSHGTLLEAEKGSDPRASTLRQYLRAFPELAPQWLLPAAEAMGDLTLDEAWECYRDLIGLEADIFERHVTVDADGNTEGREVIRRLVSVDPKPRDVSLVSMRGRWIYSRATRVIEEVDSDLPDEDAAGLRTRVIEKQHGHQHQQVLIPASASRRGLDLRNRFTVKTAYDGRAALRARVGDVLVVRGHGAPITLPCREMRAVIAWDESLAPDDIWPVAFSPVRPPNEQRIGQLDTLHAGRYEFRVAPGRRRAELRVERPLVGLSYGCVSGWDLADRSKG